MKKLSRRDLEIEAINHLYPDKPYIRYWKQFPKTLLYSQKNPISEISYSDLLLAGWEKDLVIEETCMMNVVSYHKPFNRFYKDGKELLFTYIGKGDNVRISWLFVKNKKAIGYIHTFKELRKVDKVDSNKVYKKVIKGRFGCSKIYIYPNFENYIQENKENIKRYKWNNYLKKTEYKFLGITYKVKWNEL